VLENLGGAVAAAIVDIGLPDRPGDALVKDIRARYPDLPIVIASGQGEAALHETFKDVERIAILSKPYFGDRLRAALMSLNVGVK
jgi:DNA-binding LytR/AlgR family response regulator